MTDQYPSASGSPEQPSWAPRSESDATVPQPGTAHDPWNRDGITTPAPGPAYQPYPQPTAYEQQPQTSYAQAGGYATPDQSVSYSTLGPAEATPKRRGRKRALVLSFSTVLLLLLGVGAYAAVRAWTGSGNVEPESAMPASVGAFARIDFNPGVRDKLAFDDLVKKFPTHGQSTSDLITSLETRAATALGLDYNADVKPWFDGRIGVAEWTHQGKPVLLLDFASKDDSAAKVTLAKVQAKEGADKFGFVIQNGYVLVAGADQNAQSEAQAAATEAKASSLAGSASFKSASGHLKGNNLVIIYADLHALGQLMSTEASALGGFGGGVSPFGLGGLLAGPGGAATQLNGTIIIGASVVDNGVEIRAHAEGSSMLAGLSNGSADARAALDALPETTIAALSLDGLDPNGTTAKSLGQALDGLLGRGLGGASPAVSQAATALLTSKVITVALTGLSGGLPSLLVSADARDEGGATAIKQAVDGLLQGQSVPGLQVTQDGSHVQATFGNAGSGHLGDDSLYKETMSGMNHVQQALYLDVQKLLAAVGRQAVPSSALAAVAPIKAVGESSSTSGSGSDMLIRIIIK